jgi:RNA polymerase sigma-70 factor (ECF subfamily)
MTGNAGDADDILQETFVRAMAKPPLDRDRDMRPWLVRVAINLGRDVLRRRRRERYPGPWLPSPIQEEPPAHEPQGQTPSPEARYELMESVSIAFLLTLEALSPMQRAVLLLRDVFDYSVRQTAEACHISEANVRTTHGRARRAMHAYESRRRGPTNKRRASALRALQQFMASVANGDVVAVESLLTADVRMLSDGGGEFSAALQPVVGRRNVAAFFVGLAAQSTPVVTSEIRVLNSLPALVIDRVPRQGVASQFTLHVDVDDEGRLTEIYVVLASCKLTAVDRFRVVLEATR